MFDQGNIEVIILGAIGSLLALLAIYLLTKLISILRSNLRALENQFEGALTNRRTAELYVRIMSSIFICLPFCILAMSVTIMDILYRTYACEETMLLSCTAKEFVEHKQYSEILSYLTFFISQCLILIFLFVTVGTISGLRKLIKKLSEEPT